MTGLAACPVCGAGLTRARVISPRLVLRRCRGCGHSIADHPGDDTAGDYHSQYDEGDFLGALEKTRARQAAETLAQIRALVPGADRLLDFGCGRGWFLRECRRQGLASLAGADVSAKAIGIVRELGVAGVALVPRGEDWVLPAGDLPFAPRVLALLDVIEHFPAARCGEIFRDIVATVGPQLELVVVKMPSSGGLLYRIAAAMARAGSPSALEQLYQVGTTPPHLSYFSPRSARVLLERSGLEVVAIVGDLEFEPDTLDARARAVQWLPGPLRKLPGYTLAAAARATGAYDSITLYARPAGSAKVPA